MSEIIFTEKAFLYNAEMKKSVQIIGSQLESGNALLEDEEMLGSLLQLMDTVNNFLYPVENPFAEQTEKMRNALESDAEFVLEELREWHVFMEETLLFFLCKNPVDEEFLTLMSLVEKNNVDSLYHGIVKNFEAYYAVAPGNANRMMESFNRYGYWGTLDFETKNYGLIEDRAHALVDNLNYLVWMYFSLEDYTSKRIMVNIIRHWMTFLNQPLIDIQETRFCQYFDYDLVPSQKDCVFVDGGAYIGDTLESYVNSYPDYKKIYCYEVDPSTYNQLCEKATDMRDVYCIQKGLAQESGTMYISKNEDASANHLAGEGEIPVSITTLDEDIKEKIDFIKMDIEGGEYDALLGAKEHLKNDKPVLAISAYHNHVDIWRLAFLIQEINPEYKFYLRYYGGALYPNEYVIFAV